MFYTGICIKPYAGWTGMFGDQSTGCWWHRQYTGAGFETVHQCFELAHVDLKGLPAAEQTTDSEVFLESSQASVLSGV